MNDDGTSVSAFRHKNPDGSLGGWVAADAIVEDGAYVEPGAIVLPGRHVSKDERVTAEEITSIEPY